MLPRGEHQHALAHHRRQSGEATGSHREAVAAERGRWKAERSHLRYWRHAHRATLSAERERMAALRKEHKDALRQNKWLLMLADMVAQRRSGA
jgi:hypothetical protein